MRKGEFIPSSLMPVAVVVDRLLDLDLTSREYDDRQSDFENRTETSEM